ncbi:hypothetical protein E1091_15620 [Micromonospora fluostatini]|uniref:Uncharacterized protein n=1 Tax=Micromonospora fluostatini TaxID=1629071 RepID=A0ABY2DEM6_9ACTN|nr:hypothetical protein E1091_15620 [Micromonospora fluostatini]
MGQQIQEARRKWSFQTVTDGPPIDGGGRRNRQRAFRMIRDEGVSVVTPQGASTPEEKARIEKIVDRIRHAPMADVRDLRELQPYTTTLHGGLLRDPAVRAWMRPILGNEIHVGSLVEWIGSYDPDTGIAVDPRVEEFVL